MVAAKLWVRGGSLIASNSSAGPDVGIGGHQGGPRAGAGVQGNTQVESVGAHGFGDLRLVVNNQTILYRFSCNTIRGSSYFFHWRTGTFKLPFSPNFHALDSCLMRLKSQTISSQFVKVWIQIFYLGTDNQPHAVYQANDLTVELESIGAVGTYVEFYGRPIKVSYEFFGLGSFGTP